MIRYRLRTEIHARAPLPAADISFLNAIPAIGNRFHHAENTGLSGRMAVGTGE
jgi:hypothetical protein